MPYGNDPVNSQPDEVRFLVGDTDVSNPLLSDDEVDYLLAKEGSALLGAARAAEVLAAKFQSQASERQVGPLRIRFERRVEHYSTLARQLRITAATKESAAPYAGGISRQDKSTRASNPDRVRPSFKKRLMHYPQGTVVSTGASDAADELLGRDP